MNNNSVQLLYVLMQVVIVENDMQLQKILQMPLAEMSLLAVVQFSGQMNKPKPGPTKMPIFLTVLQFQKLISYLKFLFLTFARRNTCNIYFLIQ